MPVKSDKSYSMYCIQQCPRGMQQSKKFITESETAWDAVFDMQNYIDRCDCIYSKEKLKYDADHSEN